MYSLRAGSWRTPNGNIAHLWFRTDTSDWNTINSVMGDHDEYQLRGLSLSGLALDIGSHVGSVAIALALDNPDLRVIAVEAVPPNVEFIYANALFNGVADRVTVVPLAAAAPDQDTARIWFGATGDENATHHAFIGNTSIVYDSPHTTGHQEVTIGCVSLGSLLGPRTASFLKIDCEGCEWGFLTDPALAQVERIVGEWHPTRGHTRKDLEPLIGHLFDLTYSVPDGVDPEYGPGEFVGVRR